jgi:ABC-type dipeptide/oligopeptide/nickel transport system permease subunit
VSGAYAQPLPDRSRGRVLAVVARVVSWPLSLLFVLGALAWRLLCLLARLLRHGAHPEHGAPEGLRRVAGCARTGAAYLAFASDEMPRWDGTVRAPGESHGPWHEARRRIARSRVALLAWTGLALYLLVGVAAQAGWIAAGYDQADKAQVYVAPGGFAGPYFFGSDYIGHSVGKLALRGTAVALWIGILSAVVSCVIGTVLGALAGYFGRWVDDVVVWLYTTLESVPEMLLVLAAAYVVNANQGWREAYEASFLAQGLGLSLGLFTIVAVIGLVSWTGVCRQVRGEFIRERDLDYVTAARALGVPTGRIIFRHVLPLVLISFSLLFIGAIKYEVVLTFLGVGVEPGEASWGRMIEQSKLELLSEPPRWWQLTAATGMLFGLVLCVNLFVDALRDALDPRMKDA